MATLGEDPEATQVFFFDIRDRGLLCGALTSADMVKNLSSWSSSSNGELTFQRQLSAVTGNIIRAETGSGRLGLQGRLWGACGWDRRRRVRQMRPVQRHHPWDRWRASRKMFHRDGQRFIAEASPGSMVPLRHSGMR